MPTFEFHLQTSDIFVQVDGDPTPYVGFYTRRRSSGRTTEEAFEKVMKDFDAEDKLRDIFASAYEVGLCPETVVEQARKIPWLLAILPWKKPGLLFYPADQDNIDDTDTSPQT